MQPVGLAADVRGDLRGLPRIPEYRYQSGPETGQLREVSNRSWGYLHRHDLPTMVILCTTDLIMYVRAGRSVARSEVQNCSPCLWKQFRGGLCGPQQRRCDFGARGVPCPPLDSRIRLPTLAPDRDSADRVPSPQRAAFATHPPC
uniref:Uncharacterized protein n=1 Tax=uncultured marine group II/III euryarchaeote KM3_33_H04 TaxID=1456436 RepID=A0A075H385_9EURY|nr:hypothetical protein [uncultured marine group II/III euryarchaeote KM3_33_H04]